MKYVIRLKKLDHYEGYYGHKSWSAVPLEEAIVFDSMKRARRMQNRLNSRLLKGPDGCGECVIEPVKETP